MGTSKRRRRSQGKKINQKALLLGLSLLVAILAGTMFLVRLPSTSENGLRAVLYEEIYLVDSQLHRDIGKVDAAIYQCLYQREVPEKDVLFSRVELKQVNEYEWEFAELLIRLPDKESLAKLHKIMLRELSHLEPSVSYQMEARPGGHILCHIYVDGYHTHKIKLTVHRDWQALFEDLPKLAIIIDDLGYDPLIARDFMGLDLPISFSVLPLAPFSVSIASEANRKKYEVMIHLPMEPRNYPEIDPGAKPLLTGMTEHEIRKRLDDHLKQIDEVRGVNNHMGSLFTENPDKMAIVLRELKRRELFFVDSRTSKRSVGFKLARSMGVPAARRSVFLDNDLSPKRMKFQMERLLGMARHSGSAIGIGHPRGETLGVLKDYRGKLKNEFEVVPVSQLTE
jgi:polysaccharide deacetylase 2 family uncharacterized protein YibQ